VTQDLPAATLVPGFRLGLLARLAILCALFVAEKIFLNTFVDFDRAQAAQGLGAAVRIAQHWGFRFLVAFATAIALFAYVGGGEQLKAADAAMRSAKVRAGWMLVHAALAACLVPLSYLLYRDGAAPLPFGTVAALWVVLGLGAAVSAFSAMAAWEFWRRAARALGIIWCYAAIAALVAASAMQLSQKLWAPTATLTFDLVRGLLLPVMPTLRADVATRVLSTDRFAVEISEICSGLEGMGLMLAFTGAWLIYFRREYNFPRALLLIPLGLSAIFALNVLRIAALILIGNAGFPDVAQYGFHSQAGWIAFNAVACGLVFFSRRSRWLNREASRSRAPGATDNPTAAYLMPLLAILAAGALSHAMSGRFEIFYPLRLMAGVTALVLYRRKLASVDWRWSWRGPAVGLLVFLLWILCAHFLLPAAAIPQPLAAMSPALRGTWIVSRVAASVFIVPIAEELAYRGYLMRRLIHEDFESVPYQSVRWFAIAATAVIFGLAHGVLWLPGIAAGVAFGVILVRRGTLGETVAAHATANALIAVGVLGYGKWQLW
jgi:exosortase E/protease (VPEID-CTERM system)